MREGEVFYFTPAEFAVLMELAGEGPYSVMDGLEPDDKSLALAFSSLFRRGFIARQGDGFILTEAANPFAGMRKARTAVLIAAPRLSAAAYAGGEAVWLVQEAEDVLARRLRVWQTAPEAVGRWLLDADALAVPALRDEDAAELERLLEEELRQPPDSALLRLEQYRNGGELLCSWEVAAGQGVRFAVRRDSQGCAARIYTQEALSQMLAECFGKESLW